MRPAVVLLALVLVGAPMLSGCADHGPKRPDYAGLHARIADAAAEEIRLGHDSATGHRDGALHQAAFGLELVGYANGVDDTRDPARIPARGAYNEIAIADGHAYLAATSGDGSYGGFSILSLADPAQPRFVAHWAGPPASDIEVLPGGEYVAVATQRNSPEQLAGGAAGDAGTDAAPRGIHLVDVRDKDHPVSAGFVPLPVNGPHTITAFRHDNGNDYLLACTYDLLTDPVSGAITGAVPATQRLVAFQVVHGESLPVPLPSQASLTLRPVAQFQVVGNAPAGKLWFPHDATVQVHPLDGRTLLTVGYWDQGVRIVDFTTPPGSSVPPLPLPPTVPPALPDLASLIAQSPMLQEVGHATDFSPSALDNIHLAKAFPADIAGRHVTVAEPEIITAPEETGQVTLLDTTDPAAPQRLGWWTLHDLAPELGVSGLDFSPHNFDTWDTTIGGQDRHFVALGHYHAGVWLLDVSDEALLQKPEAVAFALTGAPFGKARPNSPTLSPNVWGVLEDGGYLYVSDEATGLHVFQYTGL